MNYGANYALMGPFIGMFWGLIWFGFVIIIVVLKRRERVRLYDLIEKASMEGKTLPPEIFGRLRRWPLGWTADIRAGLILVAIAVGLAISGVINFYEYPGPHSQLFWGPFKLFPIPGLIGVAFLIMGWLRRNEDKNR